MEVEANIIASPGWENYKRNMKFKTNGKFNMFYGNNIVSISIFLKNSSTT